MKTRAAQFFKITSTETSSVSQLEFAKEASSLQFCSTSIWRTSCRRHSTSSFPSEDSHSEDGYYLTSIMLNGQKLEEVDGFKYLGSTLTKDGSSTKEVKTKLSLAAAAMTRLNVIWKSNSISFPVNLKLVKSLLVSIMLYGCESGTLTADLESRIQAFECTCYRRLLRISYTEQWMNGFVRQVSNNAGRQEPLFATVK